MPEEYLDILDENGNLTGEKELRAVVHEKGLWHQTVYVFLYKKEINKIYFLTQQRSKNKERHPNEWTIVNGGHVKSGESIEQTIKSELYEEIGLKTDNLNFISAGTQKRITREGRSKEFVHMFFCNYNEDISSLFFNDGEVQSLAWKDMNEIEKEIKEFPDKWSDTEKSYSLYMELFNKYVA